MNRLWVPVLLALSGPVTADEGLCPLTDGQASCSRVLACVGDQGRWFHGRAFGRGAGRVAGVMSDGVQCEGHWVSRNWAGLGQADVTCSDGAQISVIYTYQDAYSGTATGRGQSSTGEAVQIWSGENVLGYLDALTGRMRVLPCAAGDLLISRAGGTGAGGPAPHPA